MAVFTVEWYVKGLGAQMVPFTSQKSKSFLWVLKTVMEFHFFETQAIFFWWKTKKEKTKPKQTKKNPKLKTVVKMFMSNLEDHISLGLALEVVEFSL